MFNRIRILVIVLTLSLTGLATAGVGPDFLIRVDLNRRADFDRAAALNLEPVYRWGNEFYVVVDGSELNRLDGARVKYDVIDRDPFVSGYYYIDAKSFVTEGQGLTKYGAEAIDQIGGATLCKSEQPLMFEARFGGDGPIPITGKKIPLVYTTPLTAAAVTLDNPILDTIVARISMDSIVAYDTRLVDFKTRYAYTDSNAAAEVWLRQKFLSFGYTNVTQDTFDVLGTPGIGHNIICTKTGTTEPEKVILIGAHFDSYTNQQPMISAPGADDNASGTVGVLEIARALATIPSRMTIVFVAFDAEEQWMIGSYYYAQRAAAAGVDIALMLNMDMIGYDPDNTGAVWINTYPTSLGYANLAARLAHAKTALQPSIDPDSPASDQLPFAEQGWHFIWAEEWYFNTPGYHNETDQLWRLNPPYWTDVVRMVAMTAFATSEAPVSVKGVELWDVGDGQSLEVRWQPPGGPDITGYRVYWGPSTANYTNSASVPLGTSSYRPDNLPEGAPCYVMVCAVNAAGWESAANAELSLAPQRLPRVPANVAADIEFQRIELRWDPNVELDFDHYVVYRGTDSMALTVYIPSVGINSYTDYAVSGHTRYYYRIAALDGDGYSSAPSVLVSGIPATFDRDVLLLDLTAATSGNPSEAEQWNVYNRFFAGYPRWYSQSDGTMPLDRSDLGQYKTVFLLDDDYQWESWPSANWGNLNWYVSHANNLAIVGWATPNEVNSAGFLYDLFHVSSLARIGAFDCVGGLGVGGFPDVVFDTARVYADWYGTLFNIWTLTPADPSSEVILRYNSATNDPSRETLPVAVRRNAGTGKAALIGLPLYYMRDTDGIGLVTALMEWFGTSPGYVLGDLNGDGAVDVFDVVALIGAAFQGLPPPTGYARADVNGDCVVDVFDVIYLIDYTFSGGAAPVPGCAK
jgi:hypothetical protein